MKMVYDGELVDIDSTRWTMAQQANELGQVQLQIEILSSRDNYDDDDFEEENMVLEKEYIDQVPKDKVEQHFEEMSIILQIKGIKRDQAVRYILHNVRD